MTAHLCLGCADDGGCDVCRPRCGQDAPVLLWAGAVSVVIVENGRRRAVEHLYLNATDPRHLHVWIAAGEGADRDQAEALAHSVAPR